MRGLTFAPVSFGGDGKYRCNVDVVLDWSHEALMEDMPCEDRLIDEKKEAYNRPVEGRGWWPTTVVWWKGQETDTGFKGSFGDYQVLVMSGKLAAYTLCWYHLTDGTWLINAWSVFFRSRL